MGDLVNRCANVSTLNKTSCLTLRVGHLIQYIVLTLTLVGWMGFITVEYRYFTQ